MTYLVIYTITLITSAFAFGIVTAQYIRYRTKLSYIILLFLLSLMLISSGFYISSGINLIPEKYSNNLSIIRIIFILSGSLLNIGVLPYLISSLIQRIIPYLWKIIFALWTGIYLILSVATFLTSSSIKIEIILSIMQLVSILVSLIVLGVKLRKINKIWWYRSLKFFLIASSCFLLFLLLDILTSLFNINLLKSLDNITIPVYMLFLNIGITHFSIRYLSKSVMISNDQLTENCINFYLLSPRETEIVECTIKGSSNKDIGEKLFISPKTVENHLTNIYKKTGTKGRYELLELVKEWKNN